ncbi:hypothetical protein K440DRAFT_637400 [Wilcoxina mikolae CBS 423.85]|nr:hypothetical protein K440DRAFT_637400 [Wilcoxina mikolae CBS 423.85]
MKFTIILGALVFATSAIAGPAPDGFIGQVTELTERAPAAAVLVERCCVSLSPDDRDVVARSDADPKIGLVVSLQDPDDCATAVPCWFIFAACDCVSKMLTRVRELAAVLGGLALSRGTKFPLGLSLAG